ncbi:hypothetical protein R1flu_025423 [Riccia fluitans]|uniref:Uncharacterized protein n=1 Tax=Riccia fluitans TaxID=41844 RepID=A0ABD1XXQ5_9MARC
MFPIQDVLHLFHDDFQWEGGGKEGWVRSRAPRWLAISTFPLAPHFQMINSGLAGRWIHGTTSGWPLSSSCLARFSDIEYFGGLRNSPISSILSASNVCGLTRLARVDATAASATLFAQFGGCQVDLGSRSCPSDAGGLPANRAIHAPFAAPGYSFSSRLFAQCSRVAMWLSACVHALVRPFTFQDGCFDGVSGSALRVRSFSFPRHSPNIDSFGVYGSFVSFVLSLPFGSVVAASADPLHLCQLFWPFSRLYIATWCSEGFLSQG